MATAVCIHTVFVQLLFVKSESPCFYKNNAKIMSMQLNFFSVAGAAAVASMQNYLLR